MKERGSFGLAVLTHEAKANEKSLEGWPTRREGEKYNITHTGFEIRMYKICGHVCSFTQSCIFSL